jgi:hypothetical protein
MSTRQEAGRGVRWGVAYSRLLITRAAQSLRCRAPGVKKGPAILCQMGLERLVGT